MHPSKHIIIFILAVASTTSAFGQCQKCVLDSLFYKAFHPKKPLINLPEINTANWELDINAQILGAQSYVRTFFIHPTELGYYGSQSFDNTSIRSQTVALATIGTIKRYLRQRQNRWFLEMGIGAQIADGALDDNYRRRFTEEQKKPMLDLDLLIPVNLGVEMGSKGFRHELKLGVEIQDTDFNTSDKLYRGGLIRINPRSWKPIELGWNYLMFYTVQWGPRLKEESFLSSINLVFKGPMYSDANLYYASKYFAGVNCSWDIAFSD